MKTVLRQLLCTALVCVVGVFTACTECNGDEPGDAGKKALLIILDGWGIGDKSKGDLITNTPTPYMDYLKVGYPHSELQASGAYVGLPDGQMGNSETGHLNIGAGRVVYQDLVKINRACADNSILENPEIKAAFSYAKSSGKIDGRIQEGDVAPSILHIMGLSEPEEMTGKCLISDN